MKRYDIKLDENDSFYISQYEDGLEYISYDDEFIQILKECDKIKTARFRVSKYGNASIISNDLHIRIENFDKFVESKNVEYMPNLWRKISKKVQKMQNEKYKGKTVTIGISGKKIATIGAVAFISIVGTATAINSIKDKDSKEVITLEPEENINPIDDEIQELLDEITNENTSIDDKVTVDINYEPTNEINRIENYDYICKKYGDIISDKCEKWGISTNLITSLMSLESAGKDKNLCQIEFSSWEDYIITCYNFRDNKYESIVLTNNPGKYANMDVQTINEQEYLNPKTNISVACMMLRYSYEHMNGHIIAGIQCYNYGVQAMEEVLEDTEIEYDMSREEILSNQNNTMFLENRFKDNLRNGNPYGDNLYVEHVFQYLEGEEPSITFKNIDENDNTSETTIYIYNTNLNNEIEDSINIARN